MGKGEMTYDFGDGSPVHTRGPVQQIAHGRAFYPLDPRPQDIFIEDIAESLSKICRFIGHTREFYSVAQHSVMVSRIVAGLAPEHARWGLLHDAAEAYIGDITRPVKKALDMAVPGALAWVEERIQRAIAERFGLPWPMPAIVHGADMIAVATEKRDLLWPSDLDWGVLPPPVPDKIYPLAPAEARDRFLDLFTSLSHGSIARGQAPPPR